jgi:hypothetical protein
MRSENSVTGEFFRADIIVIDAGAVQHPAHRAATIRGGPAM